MAERSEAQNNRPDTGGWKFGDSPPKAPVEYTPPSTTLPTPPGGRSWVFDNIPVESGTSNQGNQDAK